MRSLYIYSIAIVCFAGVISADRVSACNVCHSKNPKMVDMHRELGYKDCFNCHLNGIKSSPEEKKEQMMTDPRCAGCHNKPSAISEKK